MLRILQVHADGIVFSRLLSSLLLLVCLDAAAVWQAEFFAPTTLGTAMVSGDWMYMMGPHWTLWDSVSNDILLWKTDGTADGTDFVQVISDGGDYTKPVEMGGNFYFLASEEATIQLWKIAPQTGAVSAIWTREGWPENVNESLLVAHDVFYFLVDNLYRSDGTPEGTVAVDPLTDNFTDFVCAVGNRAVYIDTHVAGQSYLYSSDGTAEGTWLLGHYTGSFSGDQASVVDGVDFCFSAVDAATLQPGLYKTNGTPAGTALITVMTAVDIEGSNGKAFFVSGSTGNEYLWSTNGTAAGTVQLHRLFCPNSTTNHAILGGFDYFTYFVGSTVSELWKSDGTVAGTVKVKEFSPGDVPQIHTCADPNALTSRLLLVLTDNTAQTFDLWATDGTADGTQFVKELPTVSYLTAVAETGNGFFFTYADPTYGSEPWFSDWTSSGTYMVGDVIPGSIGSMGPGDSAFFKERLYLRDFYGLMWVCTDYESPPSMCPDGGQLKDELAYFSDYLLHNYLWQVYSPLEDLGMTEYLQYDLENAHLAIAGVEGIEVGDGLPDWIELKLVEHVLCNESFWAHDTVEALYLQNKQLFLADVLDVYRTEFDGDVAICSYDFSRLVPAAALISTEMRDTFDGILSLCWDDAAAPYTILPRIAQYGTCCGATKIAGELFSALGDLDGDGITNKDEYDAAMAATGDPELAILAITDAENPDVPATALFGLSTLAASLLAAGSIALRKKKSG